MDNFSRNKLKDSFARSQNDNDNLESRLLKDLPPSTYVDIDFAANGKIKQLMIDNLDYKFNFAYRFDWCAHEFLNGSVNPSLQGQGIARIANRNIFELFIENNVKEITTSAISVGCYAWVKLGYVPTDKDLNTVKDVVGRRFSTICRKNFGIFSEEEVDNILEIERILKKDDPKAIWKIADNKVPFLGDSKITWGKVLLLPRKYLPGSVGFDSCDYRYTLSYSAKFDFTDSQSLGRAMNYFYPNGVERLSIIPKPEGASIFDLESNVYKPSSLTLQSI